MISQLTEIPKCLDKTVLYHKDILDVIIYANGLYEYINSLQGDILDLRDRIMTLLNYVDKRVDAIKEEGGTEEEITMLYEFSRAIVDVFDTRPLDARPKPR